MRLFLEEYLKHSALNLGQAVQGLRFLLTHPDVDLAAPRGTLKHMAAALPLRTRRVGNDLFFALIPPHWHHTRDELESLHSQSTMRWFQAGYSPYRFAETGEYLPRSEATREPRWDPRCND
jgi:hypothetical protein